jgi:uncharacterized protein YbjT (DUF2867 family)
MTIKGENIGKTASVIGATGQTGKHVVQKLIEQNIRVRVLSRSPSKAKKCSAMA